MYKTRKKELIMEYKHKKTEMGAYVFECLTTEKSYIGCYHDLKAILNSNRFKLMGGMHPNKNLQNDWTNYGESNFSIRVLEMLPYDKKDLAKTDYSIELKALRDKWINKLENSEVIGK